MSAFDLAADHDSLSLADQARANPLDLSQPAGFFTGMGTGAVTGVGRLLADTQRTTGLALGAVAGSFDLLTGDALKAQEKVFENIVAPADKLSRHLAPKPEEIGMAGQLLHGLIKIGGEAVTFGAPGVLALETVGGTLDALDKGVDLQTAAKVGGVQGAAMTAGVIAPMTLGASGLGMNVLYGAGINLAQGVFQRGATSEIYAKAGRNDLAMQYKALDGEAMAVDAILGAAFAGGGRALQLRGEKAKSDAVAEYKAKISEMLSPEHIDAALVKNEQLKMERSGFGLPADLPSRDAHVANMNGAIDDLIEGRPVTMRQEVGDMLPDETAAKVQAEVEEVLRPAVENSLIALHGSSAIFDEFQIMPGRNPALFFSPTSGRKTQAEFISEGPFGGNLYKVSIAGGKKFDPLNDPTAAKIYADLFPERAGKPGKFIEYPDIYIDSPLIQAMRENGYNRVRVYEPSVQAFSEAVTDPKLIKVLERNGEPVAPKVGADNTAATTEIQASQRNALIAIAKRIGLVIDEAGGGFKSGGGVVRIPREDATVAGAMSADDVVAHEIAHAIFQARSLSFAGFPKSEMRKAVSNYDDLVAASREFRPDTHGHPDKRVRAHANKPEEVVADAIASVLMGKNPVELLYPLMKAVGMTERDLGLVTRAENITGDQPPEIQAAVRLATARPETVIPIDDTDATTTVAEAQGIIADLETAAKEQETGLRAAVACFLRAA